MELRTKQEASRRRIPRLVRFPELPTKSTDTMDPTPAEAKAINELKKLAKKWPKSLWLFANGHGITILRTDKDGHRVTLPSGGVDPAQEVGYVHIPNDGDDW